MTVRTAKKLLRDNPEIAAINRGAFLMFMDLKNSMVANGETGLARITYRISEELTLSH